MAWSPASGPDDSQSQLTRADALLQRADELHRSGAYEAAAAAAGEAVALRSAVLSPNDPALAQALNAHAYFLYLRGDVGAARSRFEQALAIWEEARGPDAPVVATVLNNLAMLLDAEGRYADALPLMARVVAIREAAFEPGHREVVSALNNLALLEESLGNTLRARRLWERVLLHAGDGDETAAVLNNLAGLLAAQGDLKEATRLYTRALSIREQLYEKDHPAVADVLVNVARVLRDGGEPAAAVPLLKRVLRIWREHKGDRHPDVAAALNSLAALYNDLGQWSEARTLLEESLAIWENRFDLAHAEAVAAMNNLAVVLLRTGDAAHARQWLQRALEAREAALSADHPALVSLLLNLATSTFSLGHRAQAWKDVLRAARIADRHVRAVVPALSGAEQAAFSEHQLAWVTSQLLTFDQHKDQRIALEYVFGWKGLLHEGLRRQAVMGRLAHSRAAPLAAQLQSMRRQVAQAGQAADAAFAEYERERERLERALAEIIEAEVLPEYRMALEDVWGEGALTTLQKVLPKGHVFANVISYERLTSRGTEGRQYAIVIVGREEIQRVELGDARVVDDALRRWRQLRNGIATLELLRPVLWEPLSAVTANQATHLWLSPDGMLGRAPWCAFPLERDHDATSGIRHVALVPSARALLRLLTANVPACERRALIVSEVDYGSGEGPWASLPWTATEAKQAEQRARQAGFQVVTLRGAHATPDAVAEQLHRVSFAHLATHGEFGLRPTIGGAPAAPSRGWIAHDTEIARSRSPLIESKLVLAGANKEAAAGMLTAEEMVGLPLDRLSLLVLSACETGRGVEFEGQGVLGLQAAAHAAGAQAVLSSLWPISDESSARFMAVFYEVLWGKSRSAGEALAVAQTALRQDLDFQAAVHWAGWTLSGNVFM